MRFKELKQEIIDACLWLEKNKLVIGTWGNVSVRADENTIILTPSKLSFKELTLADFVTINNKGEILDGDRRPTSEWEVHRHIYLARSDINAIIHCHPTYASAMCATNSPIPPILEEMTQLIGGEVPITPDYIRAGEHAALGIAAAKYLGNKNAVLLKNHAPVCCGKDLEYAKLACLVVEKAAQCYIGIKGKFDVQIIPEKHSELEHYRFFNQYGNE